MGGSLLTNVLDEAKQGKLDLWANWCEFVMEDIDVLADVTARIDRVLQSPYVIRPPDGADRPIDQLAADLMSERFRAMPALTDSMQRLLHGIFTGVQAEAIEWGDEGAGDALFVFPKRMHMRHLRRFRYDARWKLRLYDKGKRAEHDPDGEMLAPGGWVVHHVACGMGYPGSDGLFRALAWPWLFNRWVEKFWIQDRERNGQPAWVGKVPTNSQEEVREQMLADIESLVASGAIVLEEGHDVKAEVAAVQAKSGDGYQQYLDRNRKRIARLITGTDDAATAGESGSQAAVETRAEQSVEPKTVADGNRLMETFRRDVFTWFVEFNDWEALARLHKVEWDGKGPAVPMGEFGGKAKAKAENVDETAAAEVANPSDPTPETGTLKPESANVSGEGVVVEAATANVQQTAFNGAQIAAMMEIVASVAAGEIPRATGIELMLVAFPIDRAKAEAVMGEVGRGFVPSMPEQSTPVSTPTPSPGDSPPLARALRRQRMQGSA